MDDPDEDDSAAPDEPRENQPRPSEDPERRDDSIAQAADRLRELVAYLEREATESGLPRDGESRQLLLEARALTAEILNELERGDPPERKVEGQREQPADRNGDGEAVIDIPVSVAAETEPGSAEHQAGEAESIDVGSGTADGRTDDPRGAKAGTVDEGTPEGRIDDGAAEEHSSAADDVDVQAELDAIDIEAELERIRAEVRGESDENERAGSDQNERAESDGAGR